MDQQRSNSRMETLVEEDEEEGNEQGESFDENGIKIPGLDKYNLRTKSIQNRLETEKRKRSPRKEPKPKQRPAPLSKYRRKTANARERTRMQEINDAFQELRRVIPEIPEESSFIGDGKSNLTKITTLRLAVNYIAALSQILKDTDPENQQPQQLDQHHHHHHQQEMISSHSNSNYENQLMVDEGGGSSSLGSMALGSLDLDGLPLSPSQFALTSEDLAAELDSSFLFRQSSLQSTDPSSCGSSDHRSQNSPSTDSSIESFASGWDFTSGDSLDIADTFDLILESEEGENNL